MLFGLKGNCRPRESHGRLSPGGCVKVTCGLTTSIRYWNELQAQCSELSMGKTLQLPFIIIHSLSYLGPILICYFSRHAKFSN